jgi:hypothetical protein
LVRTIASHIEDAELRRGYLTQVEGNARVLELSESWGKKAEHR